MIMYRTYAWQVYIPSREGLRQKYSLHMTILTHWASERVHAHTYLYRYVQVQVPLFNLKLADACMMMHDACKYSCCNKNVSTIHRSAYIMVVHMTISTRHTSTGHSWIGHSSEVMPVTDDTPRMTIMQSSVQHIDSVLRL